MSTDNNKTVLIGELSLEFPEANSQERGGILADGMSRLLTTIFAADQLNSISYRNGFG